MEPKPFTVTPGTPDKLGAVYDGAGVNFALYSKNGERVELCLFDADGKTETARLDLPQKTGNVWHGHVEGLKPGQVYGYRVHGPRDPQQGHRFNPNKLLLDNYATDIVGQVNWTPDQTNPDKDSAAAAPKARVTEPLPAYTRQAQFPDRELRIVEAHVRGYSMLDPKIPAALRGTMAGLACDESIDYIKNTLHANAVEVNPVQFKLNDLFLSLQGLKNYWGYNTLGYFAPEPEYAADKKDPRREFRDAIEKLDKNGVKVILDVVFNHAGEGDTKGPTLSFRGIDNRSFYKTDPNDRSKYIDDTGCGNSLDIGNPAVRRMVLDSLRLWVTEYGVAGFRFDLAPVLGRDPYAFDKGAAFFKELAADPVLSKVIVIAEPWDIGPGGYQVGNFPRPWKEWNDRFRDDVRRYWRGDHDSLSWLATRLAGSSPEFDTPGRSPQDVVNFLTCHDGFTLHDLVSYTSKKNLANGEDNRDGANENYSANYGAEGASGDPFIIALREQQKRNMLATLYLAQGIPMTLAGDEFGNSQQGNNNAYCQDNKIGWLNWDEVAPEGLKLARFASRLAEFRAAHKALTADHFLHGNKSCENGIPDLSWISPSGKNQTEAEWRDGRNKCVGMLLNEAAIENQKGGERLLAVFNSAASSASFRLPKLKGGTGWTRVLDTAHPEDPEDATPQADGKAYEIPARSVVVFTQKPPAP
jgi:glycogen operon protein